MNLSWRRLLCALALSCAVTVVVFDASAFFLTSRAITSVFDTTRNSTGNSVFSSGNATVTAGGGTVTNVQLSAFTNVVHSSGKYAFRVTENACTSAGLQGCAIGLGSASALDNNYLGVSTGSVGIFDSGNVFIGGANVGTVAGFLPGNTVDVEVDLDAKTVSDSVNGGAFSAPVSIANLGSFLLAPAVTMNAATDAFIYNGNVSFPGFAAWNSAPSPPQTIASVNLSNTTFTPATANAVVGTVSVTMSPASPVFTGSLSLNPSNGGSGAFHLVGTQLQASASGTAANTYNDVSIVATQAGIPNSPVSITPTLVGSAGTGACTGVASVFGLTCNPAFSDNFDGTTLNTTLWNPNPNTFSSGRYSVANGMLTMNDQGIDIQCRGDCVPALPSNWEMRFRFNNWSTGGTSPGAIWSQSNLTPTDQLPNGIFNGSLAAGEQLEIDSWESQFSANGSRSPEAGLNAWNTSGSTSPYPVTHDDNLNCAMTPAGGVPSGGGCVFNNMDFGGDLRDGNFHTIGVHRFVNGSGRNQIDYLRDGIVYTSATMNDAYQFLIVLPQTIIIAWISPISGTSMDVDYLHVWN